MPKTWEDYGKLFLMIIMGALFSIYLANNYGTVAGWVRSRKTTTTTGS